MIPISRLIGMMPLNAVILFATDWCAFEGSGWNDHEAVARAYGDLRTDASSLAQGRTARAGAPTEPRLAGSQGLEQRHADAILRYKEQRSRQDTNHGRSSAATGPRQGSKEVGMKVPEPKAIVLLSGGLDSATALAVARHEGYEVHALSFRYGQRHAHELVAAGRVARHFDVTAHMTFDVNIGQFGGSALTSNIDVPKDRDGGHGTRDSRHVRPGSEHGLLVDCARLG